jgi:ribosomal protein S8
MEDHSSRVEQVKERTSELKVKVETKEKKTEEILVKQLKEVSKMVTRVWKQTVELHESKTSLRHWSHTWQK